MNNKSNNLKSRHVTSKLTSLRDDVNMQVLFFIKNKTCNVNFYLILYIYTYVCFYKLFLYDSVIHRQTSLSEIFCDLLALQIAPFSR